MPLQASGPIALSQIKAYWDAKAGQQTLNAGGTAYVASPAGANNAGYYVAKTHHDGVRASDVAPSGSFPSPIALSHFYNKSPIGEGAAVNCNCNCDCGGSGCGTSCFVAGTKILMADGCWKDVETIVVGDLVMTPRGAKPVIKRLVTTLGDRSLVTFQEDRSLFWSEEHAFLARSGAAQWLWSLAPEKLAAEVDTGVLTSLGGRMPWRGQSGVAIDVATTFGFAHRTPVRVSGGHSELALYLPMPADGEMLIAAGYLVNGDINEPVARYGALSWSGLVVPLSIAA
jgi:hypothetical protein